MLLEAVDLSVSIYILLLLIITFISIHKFNPRTIAHGLSLILFLIQFVIVLSAYKYNYLAFIIGTGLGLIFLTSPTVLTIAFLIKNIQKYSIPRLWMIGVTLLGFIFIKNINLCLLFQIPIFKWFVGYILFGTIAMMLLVNAYLLTSWLNLNIRNKPPVDYFIVLGAGLNQDKVTPLLAERIDKAIDLFNENPKSFLIMSGGQGDDEIIAEGIAMASYAISKGVPKEKLVIEKQSVNTKENILFSTKLISSKNDSFAVVSTDYHILRAEIISKKLGFKSVGYGAQSGKNWIFDSNAFVREFFAYLYMQLPWVIYFVITYTLLYSLLHYAVL